MGGIIKVVFKKQKKMEQLHAIGAVTSMQKLCVVQRNKSKHLCEHKVDQLQGSD